jgi:hypothetical protein
MQRDVRRLRDQPPRRVEQPDRAVAPLLDVGRERVEPISSVIDRRRFENTSIRIGSLRREDVISP